MWSCILYVTRYVDLRKKKSILLTFRLWEVQQDLAMKFSSYLIRFLHSCKKTASSLSAAASRWCSFSYYLPLSFLLHYCSLLLFLPLLLPIINIRGGQGTKDKLVYLSTLGEWKMVLTDIWFRSNNGTLFSRLVLVSFPVWFKSGSETCLTSASLLLLSGDTSTRTICVLLFFPPFDLPLIFLTPGGCLTGWSSCLKCLYLRRRNLINKRKHLRENNIKDIIKHIVRECKYLYLTSSNSVAFLFSIVFNLFLIATVSFV